MLFRNHIEDLDLTAADARRHLLKLQAERALAVDTGVAEVASYMADLDDEIEATRIIYTWSAVTEIATLRAEMTAPQVG